MKETLALTPALPMNRPTPGPSQEGNSASVPDIGSPPPEGLGVGSWLRFASKFWRFSLPTNPEEHPTSNIQGRTSNGTGNPRSLRRSKFDVGRSMFSLGSGESLQFQNWQRIGTMNQIGTPLPALSPQGGEGGRRPDRKSTRLN